MIGDTFEENADNRLKRIKGELENLAFGRYDSYFGIYLDGAIKKINKARNILKENRTLEKKER